MPRRITVEEFHAELKAQGVSAREHFAMICPMCRTIQSPNDLIKAGAGDTFDKVEKFVGFACVGRFTDAGPHKKGAKPGRGCDWTLGGLFRIHELEVITPDGKAHPRFELCSPDDAQTHERRARVAL